MNDTDGPPIEKRVGESLSDADGTVAVASAAPWVSGDSETTVERYEFGGDRAAVRELVARQALRDLHDAVAGDT